jgi:CheY-like chemotaxis protein
MVGGTSDSGKSADSLLFPPLEVVGFVRQSGNGEATATAGKHQRRIGPARILVVEDNDDLRAMLVMSLRMEGHLVDEAAGASEALDLLEQRKYRLVLTDHAMPGGTGAWLLSEATRRGLMTGTGALVVTAQPELTDLAGMEVIAKPVDFGLFFRQINRILSEGMPTRTSQPTRRKTAGHRVELVLYVSSASAASLQARRNLERLLNRYKPSQVRFRVCDLYRDPLGGESDRVTFTPTLVKRYPEPRMWILGNLHDGAVVEDLLRACGVDAKDVKG